MVTSLNDYCWLCIAYPPNFCDDRGDNQKLAVSLFSFTAS